MANRYGTLVGSKKISEDFQTINVGFDRVQAEMDTKGTPADSQAKADAAKVVAIATAAEALAVHKQRGADEHPTAKGNAAGFMSAADKLLVDARTSAATADTLMQRDAEGRAKVAAPAEADDIARKAETDAVQTKLDSHAADTVKHVTQAEHDKLTGIAAGAEVNQNAFSKINDVSAGSKSDTVTLVGGTGVVITTDPATKRISFTVTGEATPGAHALSHLPGGTDVIPDAETGGVSGLMSGADAQYLRVGVPERFDEIEEYVADQIAAIPPVNDASLTDKGIVQLSNATTGTREDVAATEKAVNDARLSVLSESKSYVDDKTWQKYPLTEANGRAIQMPSGSNLNNLVDPGFYYVPAAVNGPTSTSFFVEVIAQKNVGGGPVFVMQRATNVGAVTQTFYQRSYNSGTWYPWSVDLFTSVSDGKTAIAAAITGKNVPASGSDTFPQLATKIGQIQTGAKFARGFVTSSSTAASFQTGGAGNVLGFFYLTVSGLSFRPNRIIIKRANPLSLGIPCVYDYDTRSQTPSTILNKYNYYTYPASSTTTGLVVWVYELTGSIIPSSSTADAYVNDNSFRLPVDAGSTYYTWEALQV